MSKAMLKAECVVNDAKKASASSDPIPKPKHFPGVDQLQNFLTGEQLKTSKKTKVMPQADIMTVKAMIVRYMVERFSNRRRYCTRRETLMRVVEKK